MSGQVDFWARRRAGVAAEAEAEQSALDAEVLAQEHAALEELTEEEVLTRLDLPNPDTMIKGDDFSVFMAKAVPDQIRRRALRTLWRSNPVLANVDMLVDYGEDFTDAAMAVENIQTAYQVGKGMLKHIEEMARQAEERESPSEPDDAIIEDDSADEDLLVVAHAAPETGDAMIADNDAVLDDVDETEVLTVPTTRRMKFRIEETV